MTHQKRKFLKFLAATELFAHKYMQFGLVFHAHCLVLVDIESDCLNHFVITFLAAIKKNEVLMQIL